MSSIERAMEKLDGIDTAMPGSDASPIVDGDAATPAGNSNAALNEEDVGPVHSAPPTTPAPTTEARILVEHGLRPRTERAPLEINFERLAAAGFLIPDIAVTSHLAEEYQHIKRRLLGNMVAGIMASERPANLIMITSSVPGEGKTFTSVNLSLSLSMEVDHTVLAVDTDIVKRDLSRAFGVEKLPGLYDLLADENLKLEDLLVRTNISNLVLLPAGQNRSAITERLASAQMRRLTDEIAMRYRDRVVIFDSPPVLATTTAAALAPLVGQLVIVVEAAGTKQETFGAALQRLEGVHITGIILNKSRQTANRGYDYYGYYSRANA